MADHNKKKCECLKISVLVPTANRPQMLRSALMSIASQSRLDLVSEVIISENSDSQESQEICNEFRELPIKYIRQKPAVHPYHNIYRLVKVAREEWVALIGDDDMWGRYHLEEAFRAICNDGEAIGFVGQPAVVHNESRQVRSGYAVLLPSLREGEESNSYVPWWRWEATDLVSDLLTRTPLNLWALVSRRIELAYAMRFLDSDALGLDSDRLIWWKLSRQGPLLIGREVTLFYRVHDSSFCMKGLKSDLDYHAKKASEHTIQIMQEAEADGIDWGSRWADAWNALSIEDQMRIWKASFPGAKEALRARVRGRCRFPDPILTSSFMKTVIKFVPPILTDIIKNLWTRLRK